MLYEPEDEGDKAPDCYEEPDDGMTDVEADADYGDDTDW